MQAHTLSHLQSITIVFLKIILTNVSAVVNQANTSGSQNMRYGSLGSFQPDPCFSYSSSNGHGVNGSADFFPDTSIDELDNIRLREITGKAVSGTLLLMLKWFKRSRKYWPLSTHFTPVLLTCQRYLEIRIYDAAPA